MRTWLFVLSLLVASPALAESWSWGCAFTSNLTSTSPSNFKIGPGNTGCYRFIDTDSTSTSDVIVIDAETAVWCFDPDNAGTAITTATTTIHFCTAGVAAGGTGAVNTCIDIGGANGNATLTGLEGAASTQNACIRTGPGAFYIRVTAACTKTSTNFCQVSVKGESGIVR